MNQPKSSTVRYQRIDNFTQGTFEHDLLIMHQQTQDTLILNSTAAAIWEALQWPQSADDLTELLLEAFPQEAREQVAQQVADALKQFLTRDFIAPGSQS